MLPDCIGRLDGCQPFDSVIAGCCGWSRCDTCHSLWNLPWPRLTAWFTALWLFSLVAKLISYNWWTLSAGPTQKNQRASTHTHHYLLPVYPNRMCFLFLSRQNYYTTNKLYSPNFYIYNTNCLKCDSCSTKLTVHGSVTSPLGSLVSLNVLGYVVSYSIVSMSYPLALFNN